MRKGTVEQILTLFEGLGVVYCSNPNLAYGVILLVGLGIPKNIAAKI